jgi:DNA-binding transcriptional LysR family regulator
MFRALFPLLFAPFFALSPLLAGAQAVPSSDAAAVRRVIEAQIDAFRRDDAARAFSYATPGIRLTFGSAENFMEMVRTQYAVVYRPRTVAFDAPIFVADGEIVQPVRLTDAEGRSWIAIYPMERGSDGVWRTNGCQLRRLGQET